MAFTKKRSGSETRKRAPIIGFRATDDERAQIEAFASRAGLTVGSYVRSRSLENPTTRAVRRPPVETAQLAQLLGMLGAACGGIQSLLENHTDTVIAEAEARDTLVLLREVATEILHTLGKRPARLLDRT